MKRYLTIFLFITNSIFSYSEGFNVIRIDYDCMYDNQIKLTNAIFEVDSTFLCNMIEENRKILFVFYIDNNGELLSINREHLNRPIYPTISMEFIQSLEDYIKDNHITFNCCYQYAEGLTVEKIEKRESYLINIGIPRYSKVTNYINCKCDSLQAQK